MHIDTRIVNLFCVSPPNGLTEFIIEDISHIMSQTAENYSNHRFLIMLVIVWSLINFEFIYISGFLSKSRHKGMLLISSDG